MQKAILFSTALALALSAVEARTNINCTAVHTGPLYINSEYNITASSISISHPSPAGLPQLVTPSPSGPHDYTFYACESKYMGYAAKNVISTKPSHPLIHYYGILGKGAPDQSGLSQDCLIRDALPESSDVANLVRYACTYTDAEIQRQQFWELFYSPSGGRHYLFYPIFEPNGTSQQGSGYTIDYKGNTRLQYTEANHDLFTLLGDSDTQF